MAAAAADIPASRNTEGVWLMTRDENPSVRAVAVVNVSAAALEEAGGGGEACTLLRLTTMYTGPSTDASADPSTNV